MDLDETKARSICAGEHHNQFNWRVDREPKSMVRQTSRRSTLACDSEWQLDAARICGRRAMRQLVAGKNMNMEAEESTVLGAVTKQQSVKNRRRSACHSEL
jgi:hypothetical protein